MKLTPIKEILTSLQRVCPHPINGHPHSHLCYSLSPLNTIVSPGFASVHGDAILGLCYGRPLLRVVLDPRPFFSCKHTRSTDGQCAPTVCPPSASTSSLTVTPACCWGSSRLEADTESKQTQFRVSPGPWLFYKHPFLIDLSLNCLSSRSSVRGEATREAGAA